MNTYVDKRIHLCYINKEMNKKTIIFYIINIIFPLFLGCLIYIFTRDTTYINKIFNATVHIEKNALINIFSFYVADYLWAYALFFSLRFFWNSVLSACLTVFWGIIWECLQISVIKGTFDFIDIFMYILATLIAIIILKFWRTKK